MTVAGLRDIALIMLAALTALVLPAYATDSEPKSFTLPANPNEVLYTDEMWDEEFVGIKAEPPINLSADLIIDITPPPANDSPETTEDLEFLFWLEKNMRSEEQVAKIIKEQKGSSDLVFGLGTEIPKDVQNKVDMVRYASTRDLDYQLYRLKALYKRPRPTQLATNLTKVIPIPGSAAYPSGHAGIAWMGGLVFSYIDPKNAGKYMQYAGDVGLRRCISGIHYLTDGAAGRELADKVFKELLKVPAYKTQIDEAKAAFDASEAAKVAAVPDEVNKIVYPKDRWDPDFLQAIKDDPVLLPRDTIIHVPPFPPNGSNQTQAELKLLREYEKNRRTPEQVKLINDENSKGGDLLTGGPLIRQFDENEPLLAYLWPMAYNDVTHFLMVSKMEHLRARPNQLDTELTTVFEVPHHGSYPSGHATHSRLLADILAEIDPKNALEYKRMALDIGRRREIAGVHYPSDTMAGIGMADQVFAKLMEVPEYKAKMEEAKAAFKSKNAAAQ